ncbi:MAG: 5-formyltetrahydrofolate cyclo-ligase [Acidobacteria bacterium]|nr:5-formyltetrahydrofolate cyclo-ligase [Acidobacteriota bacterium]
MVMVESIQELKRELRKCMRVLRAAVPPGERMEAGRRIIEIILSGQPPIPAPGRGSVMTMYVSDGGEPDFIPCLPELTRAGIVCCFPAFRRDQMEFYEAAQASDFAVGAYGLYEPEPTTPPIPGRKIDIMLLPGMAFDRSGARLGRGKSHYDRFLTQIDPGRRPLAVATCHDFQVLDHVPTDAADVKMDCLVTPSGVLTFM